MSSAPRSPARLPQMPAISRARADEHVHAALARLSNAAQALENARTLPEIKKVHDVASAPVIYARAAKIGGQAAFTAEEIKLRAERKAGELLAGLERGTGPGLGVKNNSQFAKSFSPYRQAIEEAEIGKDTASRWQQVAAVPAPEFESYLAERRAWGEQATTAGLLKEAKERARRQKEATVIELIKAEPTPPPTGPFHVIVIDPPWPYACRTEDPTHRGRITYPAMTLEQIQALPVAERAHQDCILWLWVTNAFMRHGYDCLDAWGFREKDDPHLGQVAHGGRQLAARPDRALHPRQSW